MTLQTTGAILYGYHPDNTSTSRGEADYLIRGQDFVLEVSERGQELKDSGTITVDNYQGEFTDSIDHGDRLEFYIEGPNVTETDSDRYGSTQYGSSSYSGGFAHRWTGYVRPWTNSADGGGNYTLELKVEDFVYGVLGSRPYYRNFTDVDVGEILRIAINAEAPEVDTTGIETIGVSTDIKWNGGTLLELLRTCISRGDAVAAAQGQKLIFREAGSIEPSLVTGSGEGDYRGASLESNDDKLVNQVRIAGGTDTDLEEEVLQSGTTTVTEDSQETVQITTRKSSLAIIELWTDPSGSEEDLTIRLQKDGGGQPVAIDDSKSDIVKKTLSHEFLADPEVDDDGWTSFVLPTHTLPEPNPWLIVQTSGSSGQTIGTDGSGNLAYRAWFPFPVNVEIGDPQSQEDYRLRGDRISDESLNTFSAARDEAEATLRHRKQPRKTISFEAVTPGAHNLQVADVFTLEDPQLGASGDWVVTQRNQSFAGPHLNTSITAHDVDTL